MDEQQRYQRTWRIAVIVSVIPFVLLLGWALYVLISSVL